MKKIVVLIASLSLLYACGDKKKKAEEVELTPQAFYKGHWNMSTDFKLYMDNVLTFEEQKIGSLEFNNDSVMVCMTTDTASCRKGKWQYFNNVNVIKKMFIDFGDGDAYLLDVNKIDQNNEQWIYTAEDTFSNPDAKSIWTWNISR